LPCMWIGRDTAWTPMNNWRKPKPPRAKKPQAPTEEYLRSIPELAD